MILTDVINRLFLKFSLPMTLFLILVLTVQPSASAEWLFYDEGEAVHPGSSMPYQGVRFSLPGETVRASLSQIAFFYTTEAAFCPIGIQITDHSHSARLADRIDYNAVSGWNYLDFSLMGISVPHNFYVILVNRKCGYPMLDNQEAGTRSFKGNYLQSMTTRLSHDLLIRSAIGEPLEIPVLKKLDVLISEVITVKQPKTAPRKIAKDSWGMWTFYADSSLAADNNLYGIWKQKGRKFQVSLDSEEVREYLIASLSEDFSREISDLVVAKISFTGTAAANGTIRGTVKIYAQVFFSDNTSGTVTIVRKFNGTPA